MSRQKEAQSLHGIYVAPSSSMMKASAALEGFLGKQAKMEFGRGDALLELSSQIAHDIRSPLSLLEMIVDDLPQLPEETRLLARSAISRISSLANGLLEQYRIQDMEPQVSLPCSHLLATSIQEIVIEKRNRSLSRGTAIVFTIEKQHLSMFAHIAPNQIKRVISNLINNSLEAFSEKGEVQIELTGNNAKTKARITIKDNGKGIPSDVLPKLMRKGGTFSKAAGNGLGLYGGKKIVEANGGKMTISSEVGRGTTVTIELPLAPPPTWHIAEIALERGSKIVILDDDPHIHDVWKSRFSKLNEKKPRISIHYYSSLKPFENMFLGKLNRNTMYLIDNKFLGQTSTGLELISKLDIAAQSVLVTSMYDDPKVVRECTNMKLRLLPKPMAHHIPILMKTNERKLFSPGGMLNSK